MSIISDKQADAKHARENQLKEQNRLAQLAADVFASDAGKELLEHLVKRFDVCGRTFIPFGDRAEVNALRAAVRDGERAAVMHLVRLIRAGNPDFPIPLP
jgi:hypothetical protein